MLKILLFCCFVISSCANISIVPGGEGHLSILQTSTNETESIINILATKTSNYDYMIFKNGLHGQSVEDFKIINHTVAYSDWMITEIHLNNLNKDNTYLLVVKEADKTIDIRKFKALDTTKKELRFLLTSCMSDMFPEIQSDIWGQVFKHDLDMYLLIGDNVYGDYVDGKWIENGASPQQLWQRFVDGRLNFRLYKKRELVPVYGIWDDHDYGKNNGDKNFKYARENANIFKVFFPNGQLSNEHKGFGVGYSLNFVNANFYFLDNRTFRDSANDVRGTHFGVSQVQWLKQELDQSEKLSFLISGDQFFGNFHPFESYERLHPNSFMTFLEILRDKPVLFLSGDRHLSEIQNIDKSYIGRQTFEITSSGIHAKVFPGSFEKYPNPNQIVGIDGQYNFTIIELKSLKNQSIINVKNEVYGGKTSFQKKLVLSNEKNKTN
ncbi:MAG: alkaline phosphatase family protein [Halobacteriovoraceae bacterium]|nr:alkaline phosphatase family protein [Halobacteriovoraceae bacterium]